MQSTTSIILYPREFLVVFSTVLYQSWTWFTSLLRVLYYTVRTVESAYSVLQYSTVVSVQLNLQFIYATLVLTIHSIQYCIQSRESCWSKFSIIKCQFFMSSFAVLKTALIAINSICAHHFLKTILNLFESGIWPIQNIVWYTTHLQYGWRFYTQIALKWRPRFQC